MQEHQGSSMATILLSFLAGAAAGGLIVALTTPKRGDELRTDLKGLGGRIKDTAEQAVDGLSDAYDEVRQRTGRAASEVRGGVHEAGEAMRG